MIEFDLPGVEEQSDWRTDAPFVHLVKSVTDDGMMPFAEIDVQAGYGYSPGFESVVEEMPPVYAAGYLVGVPIAALEISTPVGDRPYTVWSGAGVVPIGKAWAGTNYVYLISATEQTTLSFQCCVSSTVAPRKAGVVYTETPDNFTVASVSVGGTTFTLAADANDPQPREYTVHGKTLLLYTAATASLSLEDACICGQINAYPVEAIAEVSYYSLENTESVAIDEVVHLGHSFRRGSSLLAPTTRTFFMDEETLLLVSKNGEGDRSAFVPAHSTAQVTATKVIETTYTPED